VREHSYIYSNLQTHFSVTLVDSVAKVLRQYVHGKLEEILELSIKTVLPEVIPKAINEAFEIEPLGKFYLAARDSPVIRTRGMLLDLDLVPII
jgi:hypothetical protein